VPLKAVALGMHDNIMRLTVRPDIFLALAAETTPPPRAPVPHHLRATPVAAARAARSSPTLSLGCRQPQLTARPVE
jgi:hypothetical protein